MAVPIDTKYHPPSYLGVDMTREGRDPLGRSVSVIVDPKAACVLYPGIAFGEMFRVAIQRNARSLPEEIESSYTRLNPKDLAMKRFLKFAQTYQGRYNTPGFSHEDISRFSPF
jgi:hypothetical protein